MPVQDIQLNWKIAVCDEKRCRWRGNPTPSESDALSQLQAHQEAAHPAPPADAKPA